MAVTSTPTERRWPALALGACLLVVPAVARAQIDQGTADVADTGDTAWLLAATLIALLAVLPGLALFHASQVRTRSALATVTDLVAIIAIVPLVWIVAGYTAAFGTVTRGWIGSGNAWMLLDRAGVREGSDIPETAFALFHLAFALFAAALLAGAWIERGRMGWLLGFAALWTLIVYAPEAHWIWGGGWLANRLGTVDFAGGLVVHASAGASVLVVTLLIGRRIGFPHAQPAPVAPWLAMAGMVMLWVGMIALAGGAALAANDDAASAMLTSEAAAASGGLAWLVAERLMHGQTSPFALARGAITGLVTVSPAAEQIGPGAAIIFGLAGVAIAFSARHVLRNRLRIDDAVDVIAIHGFAGVTGTLLTAPFLAQKLGGSGFEPGMSPIRQLLAQVIGAAVVVAWSGFGSAIAALIMSMVTPMRVSEETEREGLDFSRGSLRSPDPD